MAHKATTAFIIVTLAALSACDRDSKQQSVNYDQVTNAAASQEDRVAAMELADWIIQNKRDFVLIDIRSSEEYEKGHIKTATSLPLAKLMSPESLDSLPAGQKLVVYSNGAENAAKAMVMLRLAGFDSSLLLGGYNHWAQRVLNPDIPAQAADDETAKVAKQRAISCYFTGGSSTAPAAEAAPVVQPVVPVFTPPVAAPADETPGLILDEGC